jgi:hypothetical protein
MARPKMKEGMKSIDQKFTPRYPKQNGSRLAAIATSLVVGAISTLAIAASGKGYVGDCAEVVAPYVAQFEPTCESRTKPYDKVNDEFLNQIVENRDKAIDDAPGCKRGYEEWTCQRKPDGSYGMIVNTHGTCGKE